MKPHTSVEKAYSLAHEHYLELGIDTERVVERLDQVVLSIPCWQADDIRGFETDAGGASGGIQVTGNYPGRAANLEELRNDLAFVLSMIPGNHRVNLHSIYGDFGQKVVERDEFSIVHFRSWIDWAKDHKSGIDFNATCFGHPKAGGLTLSNPDEGIRKFWIRHVQACREITGELGKAFGTPSVHNLWIPDGSKDTPVQKLFWRNLLKQSLDEIFSKRIPEDLMKDSVESKLFGIGSEAMTVGSHEFYLAYAIRNNLMICLDNGHFHPTEQVADKISALLPFTGGILLHLTRGIRWDSDHVVTLNDDVLQIAQEIVRCNALDRVYLGLDFFDASINRTGALITGARAVLKSFMIALLEPTGQLAEYEKSGRLYQRLALLEELKSMPFGAVWDYYCVTRNVPPAFHYVKEIERYEKEVLSRRPA